MTSENRPINHRFEAFKNHKSLKLTQDEWQTLNEAAEGMWGAVFIGTPSHLEPPEPYQLVSSARVREVARDTLIKTMVNVGYLTKEDLDDHLMVEAKMQQLIDPYHETGPRVGFGGGRSGYYQDLIRDEVLLKIKQDLFPVDQGK